MTAFEIAITVIFSFLTLWISMLCGRVIALMYRIEDKIAKKKPASEIEADKEK